MLILTSTQSVEQLMHILVIIFSTNPSGQLATHSSISRKAVLSQDWQGFGLPVHLVHGDVHNIHVFGPKS